MPIDQSPDPVAAADPDDPVDDDKGPNPKAITARRLAIMSQIMTRLEKPELTTGDKIWIRDTLSAQIDAEL